MGYKSMEDPQSRQSLLKFIHSSVGDLCAVEQDVPELGELRKFGQTSQVHKASVGHMRVAEWNRSFSMVPCSRVYDRRSTVALSVSGPRAWSKVISIIAIRMLRLLRIAG